MIELNLLPKELIKKKKQTSSSVDLPIIPIAVGLAAVLVVANFFLSMVVGGNRSTLENLQGQWDQMGPQRIKTETISKEIALLSKRSAIIGKIAEPDMEWSTMLSGLNEAVIPNIWLSGFSLNMYQSEEGPKGKDKDKKKEDVYLHISGYAVGRSQQATSSVAKFITSLKQNKKFSQYMEDIELESMKSREITGEEVMLFELSCKVKLPEAVSAQKKST